MRGCHWIQGTRLAGGGWRVFLTGLCKQPLSKMGWTQLPRALMGEASIAPMWAERQGTLHWHRVTFPTLAWALCWALPTKPTSLHSFWGSASRNKGSALSCPSPPSTLVSRASPCLMLGAERPLSVTSAEVSRDCKEYDVKNVGYI